MGIEASGLQTRKAQERPGKRGRDREDQRGLADGLAADLFLTALQAAGAARLGTPLAKEHLDLGTGTGRRVPGAIRLKKAGLPVRVREPAGMLGAPTAGHMRPVRQKGQELPGQVVDLKGPRRTRAKSISAARPWTDRHRTGAARALAGLVGLRSLHDGRGSLRLHLLARSAFGHRPVRAPAEPS